MRFMSALIGDRLRTRAKKAGAEPLITYYELDSGVRTELSAVTFLNWVDKTSNLVTDEQLLESGEVVELALAEAHPGHWVTAVWELACWQLGLVVSVGSDLPAGLAVLGPEQVDASPAGGEAMACSLHPLGLKFDTVLPAGVTDYAAEVRGQPDQFAPVPQSGLALAWADAERKLTQAELAPGEVETRRRLLRPTDPWTTCRDGILTALVSGGSVVIVVGDDSDRLERIVADERVDQAT
jgi:uncharacterized protein (TIGR03089 family)